MKKITLIFTSFILSLKLFAQVTPYTNLDSFQSDFEGELETEAFLTGPNEPAICGMVVSNGGDDCFTAGQVIPGFELSASNDSPIVFLPADFLPSANTTPRLGANSGAEVTIITFTGEEDVYAVGHSLHIDNNDDFNYKVYDKNSNLIYDQTVSYSAFYGVISTEPIGWVEVKNVNDSGELIGDLQFGSLTMSVETAVKDQLVYYPNPVNDILNIRSEKNIVTLKVINVLGQTVLEKNTDTNSFIDFTALQPGNYFVKATFDDGGIALFRIFRK
ncbi:T9SS type A sorting domain-containing protein [Flavobacterium salilacus subsp. salilacus]|uniref:T9SS type A sorting domain-containing protein n=1 Tax=Flavobacterium TaxID=237 RepID=UPI0010756DBB|nr:MULTISPECIES: T9SS type A sorting domain-containing protein [Flavobacterium]KAF2520131.1 T9SS type A sorting domain-containing protein [Flavobacterium salilacus subsp. salilacus]MBE1613953.1 T9SS type A sorting domain-containing protein [Flavobacterium sp. SaA2.13]